MPEKTKLQVAIPAETTATTAMRYPPLFGRPKRTEVWGFRASFAMQHRSGLSMW